MVSQFRYFGGYASIISGIVLILAHIFNLSGTNHLGTVLGETLLLTSHLLMVFAFFALYAAQGEHNHILGFLGMITGIIGTILVTAIVYVEVAGASGTTVDTVFASDVPNFIHSFGPLLFVLGMILFGISIAREGILPRNGGYLFIAGTVVFAAGSFAGGAQDIFIVIGAILTGGGFIRLGLPLIKNSVVEFHG